MSRRALIGVLLALLGTTLTLVGILVLDADEEPVRPSAAELAAYEQAILPVVRDWGSVQVLGMKPALGDLRSGRGVPARAVATEAEAWQSALRLDRDKLRAVPTPSGLEPAASMFQRSITEYIRAAGLLERAARTTGGRRTELIDEAVTILTAADQVYNAASSVVQDARRRLGLEPSPDFPDK